MKRTKPGPFAQRGRQLIAIGEALCDPNTTVADLVRIARENGFDFDISLSQVKAVPLPDASARS